jgi:hypothetical protein
MSQGNPAQNAKGCSHDEAGHMNSLAEANPSEYTASRRVLEEFARDNVDLKRLEILLRKCHP